MHPTVRKSEWQISYWTEALAQSQASGNTFRTCSTSCNASSVWAGIWDCTWPRSSCTLPPTELANEVTLRRGLFIAKFGRKMCGKKSVWQINNDFVNHTLRCTSDNTERRWSANVRRRALEWWVQGPWSGSLLELCSESFQRKPSSVCSFSPICLCLVVTECPLDIAQRLDSICVTHYI